MRSLDDLIDAIDRGDLAAVERLADKKALATKDRSDGRTALMIAVTASESDVRIVRCLIDRGAAVNEQDKKGWTALHFSAQDQQEEITRILLDGGADVDARDNDGCTPLWRCVMAGGSLETVEILLRAGADGDAQDNSGSSSPLTLAELMGRDDIVDAIRSAK